MKIAIDLTFLYGRKWTGIEYYSIDLYRALLHTGNEIYPIVHERNDIDNNPHTQVIHSRSRLILENVFLSKMVRKVGADIVIFPAFAPPVDIWYACKSRIYVVVHDLVLLNKFRMTIPKIQRNYYAIKLKKALRKASGIITISESIKKELSFYTDRPVYNCGENISSEYLNCEKKGTQEHLKRWNLEPDQYMISVSTIEPRKNPKYLLSVAEKMNPKKKLVLVGKMRKTRDRELQRMLEEAVSRGNVIVTGYIDTDCLISLYKYSYAFILLSGYEGFGRGPFEAVASGCRRIILSDIDIFRETFHDNATYIPLNGKDVCVEFPLPKVDNDFKIPFNVLDINIMKLFKQGRNSV